MEKILEKLQKHVSKSSDSMLISLATFLSNVFSGSSIMNSFGLARGYEPALLGASQSMVSPEILDAYEYNMASRTLQRLLKSTIHTTTPSSFLPLAQRFSTTSIRQSRTFPSSGARAEFYQLMLTL